ASRKKRATRKPQTQQRRLQRVERSGEAYAGEGEPFATPPNARFAELDTRIWHSQARARCLKGTLTALFAPRLGGRTTAFLLGFSSASLLACGHAPPGHQIVSAVDIQGDTTGEEAELRRGIATHPDASYDPGTLAKDLARIERFYRARGFYDATTRAARVLTGEQDRVRVEIVVEPGAPVRVARIDLRGLEALPKNTVEKVRDALQLQVGAPLDERRFHEDARAVEAALADNGFAFVSVEEQAKVSLASKAATLEYRVNPGPEAVIGEVQIEGLNTFDRRVVVGKLALEPGMRFSRRLLDRARRRVLSLGVFTNVEVKAVLDTPTERRVPIRVVVSE